MSELVDKARRMSQWAHKGQVDKAGNDYFTAHVEDVVRRLEDEHPVVQAVGYLHDVLEDGPSNSIAMLAWSFEPEIVDAVMAITHRKSEPRVDYYKRVRANPIALKVKLADVASNTDPARMALLSPGVRGRLTEKYKIAMEELTK